MTNERSIKNYDSYQLSVLLFRAQLVKKLKIIFDSCIKKGFLSSVAQQY